MAQESQHNRAYSTDEIIALARSSGFKVSRRQLSRWQSEGLIPRPELVHEKGIPGSLSVYPAHAWEQVCVLCKIAEHFRDHTRCGWYLWRLGWPVDDKYWEPAFVDAIEFLGDFLEPFLEPNESARSLSVDNEQKFELSERLFHLVQKASKQPISHPKAGPLKKRLGAEKFESLVAQTMEIMVGNFSAAPPLNVENRSDQDISLTSILDRAFSINEGESDLFVKVFEYLSEKARAGTLVDQLKTFSKGHLQFISCEIAQFEGLAFALLGQKDSIPQLGGIPVFSLKSQVRDQAILILGWCLVRQMAEIAENIEKFRPKNEIKPA
jgi:hypothetical protein